MTKLSANLGFLWTDLSLPNAIRAAKRSGFDAVECHWPHEIKTKIETEAGLETGIAPQDILDALNETGLEMLALNTSRGNVAAGDLGLSALPGREIEARAAIDQAIDYALKIKTTNIHVMAGVAVGELARQTFIQNLQYAVSKASPHGITLLIEPLNHFDAPNYFLQTSEQARAIIKEVASENLKLMFDCYHIQIMEGDISRRLRELQENNIIGHIQIASVPDRSEPDVGELNYKHIFKVLNDIGYDAPLGAEYKPKTTTEEGLAWMDLLRES